MANHEINEDQDALTRALRMIETGDPVHADVYNALFSVLINNDVFLEKLANKMIQQAMISHVTDCTNSDMVMGADQGPVFTKLIEKVKEQVDVLNTNQKKAYRNIAYDINTVQSAPGTITDQEIVFRVPFDTIPIVIVSIESSTINANYGKITAFVDNRSKTGFLIKLANASENNLTRA